MSEYYDTDPHNPRPEGESTKNQDRLNATTDTLNELFETAREKSRQACEEATAYIRKSPMEAVGIAAGAGAVLGLVVGVLLARRD